MKKIIISVLAFFVVAAIGLLFFVNKTKEITNIDALKICQKKDTLEISLSESAYYIKSASLTESGNSETLHVVISTVSVYAIGYGKLLSNIKLHKNENIKYIKVCDSLINVKEGLQYCR